MVAQWAEKDWKLVEKSKNAREWIPLLDGIVLNSAGNAESPQIGGSKHSMPWGSELLTSFDPDKSFLISGMRSRPVEGYHMIHNSIISGPLKNFILCNSQSEGMSEASLFVFWSFLDNHLIASGLYS